MTTNRRRRFTADFKKRVALEALRGDRTVQAIAAKHEVHPNQVGTWKRQAIEGLDEVFARGGSPGPSEHEATIRDRAHSRFPGAVCRQRWTVRLGEVEPVFGQTGRVVLDITARTAHDGALKWTRAPSTPRAARSIFATFPSTCALPSGGRWSLRRVLQRPGRQRKRSSAKSSCGPSRTSSSAPSSPPCCNARCAPPRLATRRAPSCATCPGGCAERRPGDRQRSHLPGHDGAGHDAVLPRETRPSGEAEAGTLPRLGGAGHLRPVHAEAGLRCKPRGRMLSSLAEAQAQLRSDGIALDIKTLRSTAYRYAARARAAQQSAACGLLDRVTGKRVVVSLDGGRVRVRRKKRGPKTKKGRNRFHTDWKEPKLLILYVVGDDGRPSQTWAPIIDGTLRGPEAVFALLLSYARQIGLNAADKVLFIADGAPWIWQRIQRLIAALGLSPTQVLGLIDFYHAAKQLSDAVKLRRWSATQRTRWLNRTRGLLKRARVDEVITALRELCRGRTAGKFRTHLNYFLKNRHRSSTTTRGGGARIRELLGAVSLVPDDRRWRTRAPGVGDAVRRAVPRVVRAAGGPAGAGRAGVARVDAAVHGGARYSARKPAAVARLRDRTPGGAVAGDRGTRQKARSARWGAQHAKLMIFGVRNQPSICCTTRTAASTRRQVSQPPSVWKKAMGMATASPIMFPRRGITLRRPRARPMTNPYRRPTRLKPAANSRPCRNAMIRSVAAAARAPRTDGRSWPHHRRGGRGRHPRLHPRSGGLGLGGAARCGVREGGAPPAEGREHDEHGNDDRKGMVNRKETNTKNTANTERTKTTTGTKRQSSSRLRSSWRCSARRRIPTTRSILSKPSGSSSSRSRAIAVVAAASSGKMRPNASGAMAPTTWSIALTAGRPSPSSSARRSRYAASLSRTTSPAGIESVSPGAARPSRTGLERISRE